MSESDNTIRTAGEELLAELHNEVAKELLRRVKSKDAKPADIAAAIKFLKDNGIEAIAVEGSPLDGLTKGMDLPFPDELYRAN